jgi:hypothetical protein
VLIVKVQDKAVAGQVVVDPLTFQPVSVDPGFPNAMRVTTWPTAKFKSHRLEVFEQLSVV